MTRLLLVLALVAACNSTDGKDTDPDTEVPADTETVTVTETDTPAVELAAVTGLEATVASNGSVSLSWTPPQGDYQGAVVASSLVDAPDADPVDGTPYSTGEALGSAEVLIGDAGSSAADVTPWPGRVVYEVFPYDGSGAFGPGATVSVMAALPEQQLTLTIDPVTQQVLVADMPYFTATATARPLPARALFGTTEQGSRTEYTAVESGAVGNDITMEFVNSQPALVVTMPTRRSIRVEFPSAGRSAQAILDAVEAHAGASALVTGWTESDGNQAVNNSNISLTGGLDDALLVTVNLTSQVARPIYHLHGQVEQSVDLVSRATGARGFEGIWFGAHGIPTGGTRTASVELRGVTGTDPIVVSFPLLGSRAVLLPANQDNDALVSTDLDGNGFVSIIGEGSYAYSGFNEYPGVRECALLPDGETLLFGARTNAQLRFIDLTTGQIESVVDLSNGDDPGFADSIALSPDGAFAYVSVTHGGHAPSWFGPTDEFVCESAEERPYADTDEDCDNTFGEMELVKVDLSDGSVVARAPLGVGVGDDSELGYHARARDVVLLPDGDTAVVGSNSASIYFVDTTTMTLSQTVLVGDPRTEINPTLGRRARQLHVTPDGATTIVAMSSGAAGDETNLELDPHLVLVDNSTYAVTVEPIPDDVFDTYLSEFRPSDLATAADGGLFLSHRQDNAGLVHRSTAGVWSMVTSGLQGNAIVGMPDGSALVLNSSDEQVLVAAEGEANQFLLDDDNVVGYGHCLAVTPY